MWLAVERGPIRKSNGLKIASSIGLLEILWRPPGKDPRLHGLTQGSSKVYK